MQVYKKRANTSQQDVPSFSLSVKFTKSSPYHKRSTWPEVTVRGLENTDRTSSGDSGIISWNFGPLVLLRQALPHKLTRRQKNAISRSCYDNIDLANHAAVRIAAPVRPMVDFALIASDVTMYMNKFNCQQTATGWNRERAKLVVFRAKTNRDCVQLDPGIWKTVTVIRCVRELDVNSLAKLQFSLESALKLDERKILFIM